jgi:hypothetical protein
MIRKLLGPVFNMPPMGYSDALETLLIFREVGYATYDVTLFRRADGL